MPKVSVIVPVYKTERFIHRCIDSILEQTFTDFELVLVDDCSPDNCPVICDEYRIKDSRVRVLHKKNRGGVSAARNDGISVASGAYVTFVDSDDWVMPDYLNILYNAIADNKANVSVIFAAVREHEPYDDGAVDVLQGMAALEKYSLCNNELFRVCWGKLVDKKIAQACPFPVDRSYSEDMATVYKWYSMAERVVETRRTLYMYTYNEDGVCLSGYGLHRLGNLKTLREICNFMNQHNLECAYTQKMNEYLGELCYQYQMLMDIDEKKIAKCLKREFNRLRKNEISLPISCYATFYEVMWPKRMWVYWTLKGISAKIRKLWRNK